MKKVEGLLPDASLVRRSRHVPPVGGPREDPGHAGEAMSLGWPGEGLGRGRAGLPCSGCCPRDPTPDRPGWRSMKMDGWMDEDSKIVALNADMSVFEPLLMPKTAFDSAGSFNPEMGPVLSRFFCETMSAD